MFWLEFVACLPYLKEADSGVEPVEDGQWHRYVGYDCPGPHTEELEMLWIVFSMSLLHSINHPHGGVSHNEERDQLPARFAFLVGLCLAPSAGCIKHQDCLRCCLCKSKDLNDHSCWYICLLRVVESDNGKYAIHVHSGL